MDSDGAAFHDLDHVLMRNGRVYRVLGDLDSPDLFLGYNVYTPDDGGDRLYQGRKYRKNFIEDEKLPADVFDTYESLAVKDDIEHHDPIRAAKTMSRTFQLTIWHALYGELTDLFGHDSVGIFGSSMFGLHLTPSGDVRKDIDFVVQGIDNVRILQRHLPSIRQTLGFTEVSLERQLRQHRRYQRVFRNEKNSIQAIIARRWTGLQLSPYVVTTIRLRDSSLTIPVELVNPPSGTNDDIIVSGRVTDADNSNLFPRRFTLITDQGSREVYIFWWKFSTPVRDGDQITLCGSLLNVKGRPVIRMTNFIRHWLSID